MPVLLNEINELSELEKFESVLIVPCRFCPAASSAVKKNTPYFEFFKKFLTTASYEEYIKKVQSKLGRKGVKKIYLKVICPTNLSYVCGLQDAEKKLCGVQRTMMRLLYWVVKQRWIPFMIPSILPHAKFSRACEPRVL